MKPKFISQRSIRRALRRGRRPIMAVVLTAAFIKCFALFLVIVSGIVIFKIAIQKPPAEFDSWH